jgi:uncharacterized protein YcbX
MAVISALNVYPVKGCKGITLPEVDLTATGLRFDRHWVVTDEDGRFVTQRELPRMALISTRWDRESLVLNAPEMEPLVLPLLQIGERVSVTVWRDRCFGFDQGTAAAAWFSAFLARSLRLVRFDTSARRGSDATFTDGVPAWTEFSDGFAILIISEASLADLNARLDQPLPMNRFRPNVVITDVGAYDEDHFRALVADEIELRLVKACTRCQVTTTDQDTGLRSLEPLRTLGFYRMNPALGGVTFGQNAIVVRGAGEKLHVGQTLEEVWNF